MSVNERVRKYRLKKHVDALVDQVAKVPPRLEAAVAVHPVVMKMIAGLDRRLLVLERAARASGGSSDGMEDHIAVELIRRGLHEAGKKE